MARTRYTIKQYPIFPNSNNCRLDAYFYLPRNYTKTTIEITATKLLKLEMNILYDSDEAEFLGSVFPSKTSIPLS